VKLLLIVGAITTGLSLLADGFSLAFPPLAEGQELGDNPIGVAVSLAIFLLAIVEFVTYWITVVFFCMWVYRAYDNVRAFNPWNRLNYSRGLAVGSFFIPFMNLVVPYRVVKEIWQKSGPPDEGLLSEPNPPAWFPAWWLFWILASVSANLSMRLSFDDNIPVSTATIISIVASALFVLASVFAYTVVDEIDKKQEDTSGKLGLGKFSGPPPPPNLSMSQPVY
jgi:hypothetical protein